MIKTSSPPIRPSPLEYSSVVRFVGDMIAFLKASDRGFSVLKQCKTLRRTSPALISLIIQGKRRLTFDRAEEIARLLKLTASERQYFVDWVGREAGLPNVVESKSEKNSPLSQHRKRKIVSHALLKDWLNVYVKDAFGLESVAKNPERVYSVLGGLASQKRIDRAIEFLLREGYLRRTPDQEIVQDTPLNVLDQRVPSERVRQFHKGALKVATNAIDRYSTDKRYANALILPLNQASYGKLLELIEEFTERLQSFAESIDQGETLHQLIINLSPTGGKS